MKGLLSMVELGGGGGFSEVIGCENAVDALDVLTDRGSDLVITDLFMQSLSGLEMIEMARNMEIDTRFVILTGHGLFEYAQKAVALGVKRFLTKPIQPVELLDLLREMRGEILAQQRMEQSLAETQEKTEGILSCGMPPVLADAGERKCAGGTRGIASGCPLRHSASQGTAALRGTGRG